MATASILDVQGDALGTVVFLLANPTGGAQSVGYRNGTFTAAAVAFTDYVQNYLGLAPEMRLDGSGHATVVLGVLGLPSNNNLPGGNYSIAAVEGDVASNSWSPLQVISGADDAGGFVFELNSAGVAVVAYQNNYYVQLPPSVRAVARTASGATWSAPVTIDNSFPTYAPIVADINPSGQAVIGYTGYHYVGSTTTIADATVRAFLYKP
jgi:hypothetical protein